MIIYLFFFHNPRVSYLDNFIRFGLQSRNVTNNIKTNEKTEVCCKTDGKKIFLFVRNNKILNLQDINKIFTRYRIYIKFFIIIYSVQVGTILRNKFHNSTIKILRIILSVYRRNGQVKR